MISDTMILSCQCHEVIEAFILRKDLSILSSDPTFPFVLHRLLPSSLLHAYSSSFSDSEKSFQRYASVLPTCRALESHLLSHSTSHLPTPPSSQSRSSSPFKSMMFVSAETSRIFESLQFPLRSGRPTRVRPFSFILFFLCSRIRSFEYFYQILSSAENYLHVCFHSGLSSDVFMVLILYLEVPQLLIEGEKFF
jgi:hypothetical protein